MRLLLTIRQVGKKTRTLESEIGDADLNHLKRLWDAERAFNELPLSTIKLTVEVVKS